MVNLTCLERIVRLIDNDKLKPMKPWGQRSSRRFHKPNTYMMALVKNIRKILNWISGFDIIEMLKSMLLFISLFFIRLILK